MPTAAYLGTPAHLAPLEYVDEVRAEQDSRYAIQRAASRSWAFVSAAPGAAPRRWTVNLTATSETAAALQGLADGAYGNGPFAWLPESAYISNALTPRQSGLLDFSGPGVTAVGGWSPRSALGPALADLATQIPIMGNHPVTATVDVSGAATLRITLRNASGTVLMTREETSDGTAMQRLTVTVPSAPATARTADIRVGGHTYVTRPQVTWLGREIPWAPGAGADSVIVESVSMAPMQLDSNGELLQRAEIQIQEVN